MRRKKKSKALPPRHKRMKRPARLVAAKSWLPTCSAKNIAKAYKNHFSVDWECTFKELEMLGVHIDPEHIASVKTSIEAEKNRRQTRRGKEVEDLFSEDSDENFALIAGYTSGGLTYGISWEEWDEILRTEGQKELSDWTDELASWPKVWMVHDEDLEFGEKLLPYLEGFLNYLYDLRLPAETFIQYREYVRQLGDAIVRQTFRHKDYEASPIKQLKESVADGGIVPDHRFLTDATDLRNFENMCNLFETFLNG